MTNYTYAIGRRKCATVTLKLYGMGKGQFSVVKGDTKIPLHKYFGGARQLYANALAPFVILDKNMHKKFDAEIVIHGGGVSGHSDAIRLAFSRALIDLNSDYRLLLKPHGLLARDARIKERKKAGLHGARKKPTWSKR